MDTKSITHPAPTDIREAPHGCYDGTVYIGHLVEEDGEAMEIVEAVPCRKRGGCVYE